MKKRLVTLVLMFAMAVSLVACGGNNAGNNTEKPNTESSQQEDKETEDEETEETGVIYTIKVVDEANNPVAGAVVQLCKDSCIPKETDANGVAEFKVSEVEDGYKGLVAVAPEGYVYDGGDVYFENGETEIVLVIKAAQQ